MAIKIHAFDTDADFQAAYNGSAYTEPWVSYTRANESVKYNKSEYEKLLETPLTFEVTSDGVIRWNVITASYVRTIQYSKNGGEWTSITSAQGSSAPSISVVAGDVVQFKGNNATYNTNRFSGTTCSFIVKGNIMSLINSENFSNITVLESTNTFATLFTSCTGLTDSSELMLPATALTTSCYSYMFYNCTSLTQAPELPATTLADSCYEAMYVGCSSLTTAPILPATTLAQDCYYSMFTNCTSLTAAPELPATNLSGASSCYYSMFYGCTSLTTAPALPATTLAISCYGNMFQGCTSLTQAPELPATTLEDSCYGNMFYGCTSLTAAPELLATTVAHSCCIQMFEGCTSLTTAPELLATVLAPFCYQDMFSGCTNLNYIKCLATDISANQCTSNWVQGVQTTSGTFVAASNLVNWPRGVNGIPTNWRRENIVESD